MDDLILNKVKAPNSLAKISVPKYLKGALVLNITFKKIDWDLTPDNIERHRDDETGGEYIDFYGVIVVRAIDDVGTPHNVRHTETDPPINTAMTLVIFFRSIWVQIHIIVVNMKAVYYAVLPGNRIAAILLILHTLTKMVILNCWILRIWHLRY